MTLTFKSTSPTSEDEMLATVPGSSLVARARSCPLTDVETHEWSVARGLVGRDRESEVIGSFLDEAVSDGAALVLFGDAGVGKTALLNAGAEAASTARVRVVRGAGVEFEADLGYSGLNQLLLPLLGASERPTSVHYEDLLVALGLRQGPPPDRLAVSTEALALLRRAADAQPLLVVVDDLHWLDRPSAGVLGFVARRLGGSRVGLIAASRPDPDGYLGRGTVSTCEVAPLDEAAACRLLDSRFGSLVDKTRQRVLFEAQGNPLALLELPVILRDMRLGSGHGFPAVLPLGRRLQTLFASRVSDLPFGSRWLLLLAALSGTGDLGVLRAARGGGELDDLLPAEEAALVRLDQRTHQLMFRHPLVRSTVVQLSTASERRAAHRALAEVLADQPDLLAWHMAEGAAGSDEHVASLLEQAARRALHRGNPTGAVTVWLRAADLSPRGSDRGRRLADAAYVGAEWAGDLQGMAQLLDEARKADPEWGGSLQAAATTAFLLINREGEIETAHRMLVGTIETRAGSYEATDSPLVEALHTLSTCCFFGGRPELWQPFHAALARLRPRPPVLLTLGSALVADPARATPAAVGELETIISRLHDEADSAAIIRTGRASLFVDRMSSCREAHWRVVRDGRQGGAVTSAIYALTNLCLDDYLIGEWDRAQELGDEGVQLCESHGYELLAWPLRFGQSLVAAGRGDDAMTSALTNTMQRWAGRRRAGTVLLYARHAQGLAALGRGDFETAYHHFVAVNPPGSLSSHVPLARWTALDLVEAAVHSDRQAEAIAHSDAMRQADLRTLSPRLALVSLGAAAIATPDHDAGDLFEQALAIPGVQRWPFDLARVHLAYGQRLRRSRAVGGARIHLLAALQIFEWLSARPWASRAAAELRVTGPPGLPADRPGLGLLTPQEREIAQLAASGLTNRQIGEKLFCHIEPSEVICIECSPSSASSPGRLSGTHAASPQVGSFDASEVAARSVTMVWIWIASK